MEVEIKTSRFEKEAQRSEIIKNYITILALLAAGIWALITFVILREGDSAAIDIANKESALQVLDLSIEVQQLNRECEDDFGLRLDLKAKNIGTNPVAIDLDVPQSLFSVAKLSNTLNDKEHYKLEKTYHPSPVSFVLGDQWVTKDTAVIQPGVTSTIPYFVIVDSPGYYVASFFSKIPLVVEKVARKNAKESTTGSNSKLSVWSEITYFSVVKPIQRNRCMTK